MGAPAPIASDHPHPPPPRGEASLPWGGQLPRRWVGGEGPPRGGEGPLPYPSHGPRVSVPSPASRTVDSKGLTNPDQPPPQPPPPLSLWGSLWAPASLLGFAHGIRGRGPCGPMAAPVPPRVGGCRGLAGRTPTPSKMPLESRPPPGIKPLKKFRIEMDLVTERGSWGREKPAAVGRNRSPPP